MAIDFPLNTDVLDAFNRTDAAPMTGWADLTNGLAADGDEVVGGTGGDVANLSYMTGVTMGANWELSIEITANYGSVNAQEVNLYGLNSDFATAGFYGYGLIVYYNEGGGYTEWSIVRITGSAMDWQSTILTSVSVGVGDSVGIRHLGSYITTWHKPSGGAWTLIAAYDRSQDGPVYHSTSRHPCVSLHSNDTRADNLLGGTIAPTSTGEIFPTAAVTASEAPWSDNDWTSATNIYADDGSTASVTASSYDSPDQTYVLKAYTFTPATIAAIPSGATIKGVIAKINT